MKKLSTSRGLPVKLPHPLYFQHTTQDGRLLSFRSPMPSRLTALNAFWTENDFQLEKDCLACPKDQLEPSCSLCGGTGKYRPISEAESVERTEKVMCAVLASFWADPVYILEAKYTGDMDEFALEASFEIMGGEYGITWADCAAIFKQCTDLLIRQLYSKSGASDEVKETVDFLSRPKGGATSPPSTSGSPISEETPSPSSNSTTKGNGSSLPIIASEPDTTGLESGS